jgi:hypothetical protein
MLTKPRSPLQPFAWLVSALARLSITALLLGVALSLFTSQVSIWGIGERSICVQNDDISVGGADAGAYANVIRRGVAASGQGLSLCFQHASAWQKSLYVLTQLPAGVFGLGLLILLWRLTAGARRLGPFARVNARRLRLLGWWLIAGDLIADNTQVLARTGLLRSAMTSDEAPAWSSHLPAFSWAMLIAGLGAITVARILTMATEMHEELAVTV